MVNLDDIRRNIEKEEKNRITEEKRRLAEESGKKFLEERKREEKNELMQRRLRIEDERWGTPQRAYETCSRRAERFIEAANSLVSQKRQEAHQARYKHRNTKFDIYRKREYLRFLLGNEILTGSVSPEELSYRRRPCLDSGEDYYVIYFHDNRVNTGGIIKTFDGNIRIERYGELDEILYEIFMPEITAERLESGESKFFKPVKKLIKFVDEYREDLSQEYSFECDYSYGDDPLEDSYTHLDIGGRFLSAENPFYEDRLRKKSASGFSIDLYRWDQLHQLSTSGGGRGSNW